MRIIKNYNVIFKASEGKQMIKPHGSEELTPKIVNTDEEKESLLKKQLSL